MALELVGGAFMGAFFNVLLERIASPEVVKFFMRKKLNEKLLKKLEITLLSVNVVLNDAEGKQIRNASVKKWLDELEDAAYDAEDLLDEIYNEVKSSTTNEVRNLNSDSLSLYEKELEQNIEDILERLEFIAKQKDILCLKEDAGIKVLSPRTPTSSLVKGCDVYGRHDDKEVIVDLLLSDDASGNKIDVIPIVGMGGIGKTTLAQFVYNDGRVKEKFDLRAWLCVSEEFDIFKITRTVLEVVSSTVCDIKDLDSLQLDLKEKLSGKRFLFVFDDVWNENYVDWCLLRSPFQYGAQGSKIIVTTRSGQVASIMQTVPSHYLGHLSNEDSWKLFAKHAFDYRDQTAHPVLEEIGRGIVKKCKGLPLAAKTLGGLLRSKTNEREWCKLLKSDIWDFSDTESNILPALRLSYHYLPSHLKRCFAYCAIFPKDFEFDKEDLILLWMAENLLQQPNRNKTSEEVGEEYFCELVSRSFFQQSRSNKSRFVMHDLINDLAQFVSGKFCARLESINSSEYVERKTRHLSHVIASRYPSMNFEAFYPAKRLHTFLQLSLVDPPIFFLEKVPHDLLMSLRYLRVLSLVGARGNVNELLGSLGQLRHLRYFDVSRTRIKKLPESITTLNNLQTLKAAGCYELTKLPRDMHNLINLRYLDIVGTPLKWMPPHISKLRNLKRLSDFTIGSHKGSSSVTELGELSDLRGSLSLQNLEHVVDPQDAVKTKLKDKKFLEELYLKWGPGADSDNSQHEKDVLDKLRPHKNLKALHILHYTGTEFPSWLGDFSFSNLVSLFLGYCQYCYTLPPLGQLPSLKELCISCFKGVVNLGPEIYYGTCSAAAGFQSFASLEILTFYSMPAWEQWGHEVDNGNEGSSCRALPFPRLLELHLEECPRLIGNLPSDLPSLVNLRIRYCKQLTSSLPKAPALRALHIDNCYNLELPVVQGVHQWQHQSLESLEIHYSCHSLKSLPLDHFPNLKSLVIWGCENLESFTVSEGNLQLLTSLLSLCIWRCPKFMTFPHGGLPAPNLTCLKLRYCSKLKSLPERMNRLLLSLKELQVWSCVEIEAFPDGGLPSNLGLLKIRNCDKLIASRMDWNLQSLTSLAHFSIGGKCENVESFPEEGLLPAALIELEIRGFSNLRILDGKGLRQLTSLKKLEIFDCSKLESIIEEGLPASLIDLDIWKCPLLHQHCKRGKAP